MDNIAIKRLLPNQTNEFLELLEIFSPAESQAKNHSHPCEEYLDSYLDNEKNCVLVATVDNTIVGGLTAYEIEMYKHETSEMFLFEIGVTENYRQKGVGTLLIQKLKEVCDRKSIRQIFVITTRDNTAALRLYNKTGGKGDIESILFNYLV